MPTCYHATLLLVLSICGADQTGHVELKIRDSAPGKMVPCRVHLTNSEGHAVKPAGMKEPWFSDHFVCPGTASVEIPAGEYRIEIERGPEYTSLQRSFSLKTGETIAIEDSLTRITNLTREGWWPGETHIHRPPSDVELLMLAEDLYVGVVETWWNNRNLWKDEPLPEQPIKIFDGHRMYDALGGEDERGGGAILISGLKNPLPIAGAKRESPPSLKWLELAKSHGAWVDAEKPFWWDFPVWLASGQLDSIGIANNHMNRSGIYAKGEAWGRPRNREQFPEPYGNGDWTQTIYYHALNAGFRLPPSAGSASGVLPNPVGYNRMYAYLDKELTWDNWWSAVRAGRVFVTNGPLLRLTANHEQPGNVFRSNGPLEVTITGQLDSRDPIAAIELVHDGRVEQLTSLPAKIMVKESGWFLVRAKADVPNTYRFASTGPWYVEIGESRQMIRRESCEFFRQWMDERIDALRQTLASDEERREVLPVFENTRRFWNERPASAIGTGDSSDYQICYLGVGGTGSDVAHVLGIINPDGTHEQYPNLGQPNQKSWQFGPQFSDGRRIFLFSYEETNRTLVRAGKSVTHDWIYDLLSHKLEPALEKDRPADQVRPYALLPGDQRVIETAIIGGEERIFIKDLDGDHTVELTSAGGGFHYALALSHDGTRLACHVTGGAPSFYNTGAYSINVFDLKTNKRILVAGQPGHLFFGPNWSPDDSQLVYLDCNVAHYPNHFRANIGVGKSDGSGHRVITSGELHWFGTPFGSNMVEWAPDGTSVTYTRLRENSTADMSAGGSQICRLDPVLGAVTELTPSQEGTWDFRAVWCPDGSRIVFGRVGASKVREMWIMDVDGANPHRLTDGYQHKGADHFRWIKRSPLLREQ